MPAQYPSALVTTTQLPTTRLDSTATATNHIGDHNNAALELIAIEAELGVLPKADFATVKARGDANTPARAAASPSINHAMAIVANAKTTILLAQSTSWEPLVMAQLSTLMVASRLTLQAVWLSAGDIVTAGRMYITVVGSGAVTALTTSLWSYDGTTWTCQRVSANYADAAGFKTNVWGGGNYTVPSNGIYYVGSFSNIAVSQPTIVGGDAGTTISGDFFADGTGPGTPTNWPRQTVFAAASAPAQAATLTGGSTAFRQFPWVGLVGTQQ